MVSLQPVTFPLRSIVQTVHGPACACWKGPHCSRIGKHPAVEWREVSLSNPSPGRLEGGGVGLRTGASPKGSGIVVVDIDTKEAAAEWERRGGSDETKTVITGRPGIQYYFEHGGFPVANSVGANGGMFPGIDIRGDGGFVVMPGSPHKTGRTYKTLNPDAPIIPMPAWLVEWLQARPAPQEVEEYEGDVEDEDELLRRRRMYIEYLETAEPSVQGQGGDQALFEVVQYGAWDLALPTQDVLELITEYFDPRCEPPWDHELEERVLHKAHFAKTSSNRPRRVPIQQDEEDEWTDLLSQPKKDASAGLSNFIEAFKKAPPPATLVHPENVTPEMREKVRAAMDRASDDMGLNDEPEPFDLMGDYSDVLGAEPTAPSSPPVQNAPDPFKMQWGGWSNMPAPQKWLIEHFLVANKVSMIYAEPGSIKTWLALAISIAIASDEPFLKSLAVDSGPVLYIDFEDGSYEFHRRTHLLSHGEDVPRLGFSYSPDALVSLDFWKKLAQVVMTKNVKLVVIDTLAGGTPGADENSSEAAMPLQFAGKLTESLPNVSVLFLHHANKAGGLRGTSAFLANVDTLFKLEKEQSNENGVEYAKLTCVKSGQKKVAPIDLRLSDSGGLERNVKSSDEKRNADEVNLFQDVQDKRTFEDLRSEILLLIEQRGPLASTEAISALTFTTKTQVHNVLAELGASGSIVKTQDGWIRDSEALRRVRLRDAIHSLPGMGKTRVVATAYVKSEYFDHMVALGHVRNFSSDRDIPGFVWHENP